MTIAKLIQIGKELDSAFGEVDGLEAYQAPPSVLPAGCPLYAGVDLASKMFSMSAPTIRGLIKHNADFPALRIGGKIIIDVPGVYKWLSDRNGGRIELEG